MMMTLTPIMLLQATPDIAASWQGQILMFLLTVLSATLTAAVPILVLYLRKRFKLGTDGMIADRVADIAQAGIRYADEQARKAIKERLPAQTGNEKRDTAASFVLGELARYKLPTLAAEKVAELIESHLPIVRNGATPLVIGHPIEPLPPAAPTPTKPKK